MIGEIALNIKINKMETINKEPGFEKELNKAHKIFGESLGMTKYELRVRVREHVNGRRIMLIEDIVSVVASIRTSMNNNILSR